jgi:hypothetical protein
VKAVAAGGSDGVVLQWVDPIAVLDAVVGVVEQIKRQRLKLQFFALPDHKTAGQPNIDPPGRGP